MKTHDKVAIKFPWGNRVSIDWVYWQRRQFYAQQILGVCQRQLVLFFVKTRKILASSCWGLCPQSTNWVVTFHPCPPAFWNFCLSDHIATWPECVLNLDHVINVVIKTKPSPCRARCQPCPEVSKKLGRPVLGQLVGNICCILQRGM